MRGLQAQVMTNERQGMRQLYLGCVPVKLDDGEAWVVRYAVNSGYLHTVDNVTD